MCALFLFFALLLPSLSTCQALAPGVTTSPSASLRPSTKPISPVPAPSPSSPSSSFIAKISGDFSSNDGGIPFPAKRDATSYTSRPSLRPSAKATASLTPSTMTTRDTSKLVETKDFKLYLTLFLSNINSEMNATTAEIFQNATHTFMADNIQSSPGVTVDVASIVVIGQLLFNFSGSNEREVSILQVDAVVSGSITMDRHVTNLTRIAVQNSISLTPYSNSDLLRSYLTTASAFFKSIDQFTTTLDNGNMPVLSINTESDERGVSKTVAVAVAGALMIFLLLALGGFIAFRRDRKKEMRKKKLWANGTLDQNDSIEGSCIGRPPVYQIASGDQASVASSVSGVSEILCGVGTYLKGKNGSVIKEQYPVQERRTNAIKEQNSTNAQERRSDQASNASVFSDLLFDNWSVFSAVDTINMIDIKSQKDDLVGTFVIESLGEDVEIPAYTLSSTIQEPSETSSWGSIERQNSFGYF